LMFSLCEGQKVCAVLLADQGAWWWKVMILWHDEGKFLVTKPAMHWWLEPLVVPNCSEEENVQRCINWFTPCCAQLVSYLQFVFLTATTKNTLFRVELQRWDWKTDQLKWRTRSCLFQWQQNYIPHQIHTTVQLQQRWKEATKEWKSAIV